MIQIQNFIFLSLIILSVDIKFKYSEEPYSKEITDYGYVFNSYKVTTSDGYILSVWRVSNPNVNPNGKVVILQHGLFDDSYTFFALKKNFSLGYLMADQGYDVWIPNSRGNIYSNEHINSTNSADSSYSDYWKFSFEQMAEYDLPSIIDYIKKVTGVNKMDYIGHSQGSAIFIIKYMTDPEYLEKNINKFIALGTVPSVSHVKSLLLRIIKDSKVFEELPINSLLYSTPNVRKILRGICKYLSGLCGSIISFIVETEPTNRINYKKYLADILNYEPAGSSHLNIMHWLQCAKAKRMQRFDYGPEENLRRYGNINPPPFDINKIKKWNIPSVFTRATSDTFSSKEDVTNFLNLIENKSKFKVLDLGKYNHLDYLWAEDAKEDIYERVINFLKYGNL